MEKIFGTKHIIILCICLILIVGLFILSRKMKFKTICMSLFYIGMTSEFVKVFYYIVANEEKYGGILPKSDLPFHLCSIQIIFIAVVCFINSEKIKRFILSFMMPSCLFGGIAAIFLATTSSLNGGIAITLQYFLYHVSIVVFGLYLLTSKEVDLNIKDYFNCLKFLLIIFLFAIYINSIIYDGQSNINFMYVAGPPMEGLPYLNENQGWLMYILKYASLVVVCISLTYCRQIYIGIKSLIDKKLEE